MDTRKCRRDVREAIAVGQRVLTDVEAARDEGKINEEIYAQVLYSLWKCEQYMREADIQLQSAIAHYNQNLED